MRAQPHRTYSCRNFVLDLDRGCLLRDGQQVKLRRKSFQVLAYLMERHGRLMGKEDIIGAVWADTFVTDDSLTRCLSEIRSALADDAHAILKTVPRRGYIFEGPVEESGFEATLPARPAGRAHNLPSPVTSFVGRAAEMSCVVRLLRDERLVTLTGAGGCGKTRLALEAAATLGAEFPDGIWLTELAARTEARCVVDAVTSSVGLRPDAGKPVDQRLTEYLSTRSLLLVIDNCEHLVDACAGLATSLLRCCPRVRLLTTSREPLRIAGEHVWRVPSLSLPAPEAGIQEIARAEAVTLMVARTKAAEPSFALTADNAGTVARLCRQLDGIPLAIELAAARVGVLSIDQIASRLHDRFRLLVGGSRTALPRQQTLHAAVDWSHELLTERERQLFRRLSVFAGGWTLEAASDVCNDATSELDTLDVLSGLLEKSLVFAEDAKTGRRFRMLETVRQYAHDRLVESGESEELRNRQLACFQRLAAAARLGLKGPEQSAWLRRLHVEHDNLRAALAWSEAAPDRADAGLEMSACLHLFWFKHGHLHEARRWLVPVLARPTVETQEAKRLAAECWFALGLTTILTGEPLEGHRHLETSLRLARELGDDGLAVGALRMIVHGLLEAGQTDAAEACASEVLAIAERVRDSWSKAAALGAAGMVHRAKGDYDTAAHYFQRELATWRASGDGWMMAASAADAAETELQRGNVEAARALVVEALQLADRDDAPTLAWNLDNLGWVLAAERHELAAARVWGAAEAVYERIGLKLPGYMAAAYARAIEQARTALGDEAAFTAAWTEGRRMTPAEAIAMARLSS